MFVSALFLFFLLYLQIAGFVWVVRVSPTLGVFMGFRCCCFAGAGGLVFRVVSRR